MKRILAFVLIITLLFSYFPINIINAEDTNSNTTLDTPSTSDSIEEVPNVPPEDDGETGNKLQDLEGNDQNDDLILSDIDEGYADIDIDALGEVDKIEQKSVKPKVIKLKKKTCSLTMEKGEVLNADNIIKRKYNYGFRWKSTNKKIVSSTKGGTLKAKKNGKAVIKGYYGRRLVSKINVLVGVKTKKINVKTADKYIRVGKGKKINPTVYPKNASNKKLKFVSLDKKKVKISKNGYIRGKKAGVAKIKITSKDSRYSKIIKVRIIGKKKGLVKKTGYGKVRGYNENGKIVAWKGIRYATAKRWQIPKAAPKWRGVKNAYSDGNKCTQFAEGDILTGSEDCLNLNIVRPDTTQKKLPVIVYIHGGHNIKGSKSSFNPNKLSYNTNSVIININYRIGAFGFMPLDCINKNSPTGNYGLLDIIYALKWIKKNVSAFGGNNNNITIFGFSGGARNAMALLSSSKARGLFNKAMLVSGVDYVSTKEEMTSSFLENLATVFHNSGRFPTIKSAKDYIANLSPNELRKVVYGLPNADLLSIFPLRIGSDRSLVYEDGYIVKEDVVTSIKNGTFAKVPIMIGCATSEFSKYTLRNPIIRKAKKRGDLKKNGFYRNLTIHSKTYGSLLTMYQRVDEVAIALSANASYPNVYAYRFNWGNSPSLSNKYYATFYGTYHDMNLKAIGGYWKAADTDIAPTLYGKRTKKGRTALSENMQQYIYNFIRTSSPNGKGLKTWNPWSNSKKAKKVMILDASRKKDISKMSSSVVNPDAVWKKINKLNEKEYNMIIKIFEQHSMMKTMKKDASVEINP